MPNASPSSPSSSTPRTSRSTGRHGEHSSPSSARSNTGWNTTSATTSAPHSRTSVPAAVTLTLDQKTYLLNLLEQWSLTQSAATTPCTPSCSCSVTRCTTPSKPPRNTTRVGGFLATPPLQNRHAWRGGWGEGRPLLLRPLRHAQTFANSGGRRRYDANQTSGACPAVARRDLGEVGRYLPRARAHLASLR